MAKELKSPLIPCPIQNFLIRKSQLFKKVYFKMSFKLLVWKAVVPYFFGILAKMWSYCLSCFLLASGWLPLLQEEGALQKVCWRKIIHSLFDIWIFVDTVIVLRAHAVHLQDVTNWKEIIPIYLLNVSEVQVCLLSWGEKMLIQRMFWTSSPRSLGQHGQW